MSFHFFLSQTRELPCELNLYCFQNRGFNYQQKKNQKRGMFLFVNMYSLSLFLTFVAACSKVLYLLNQC